MENTAAETRNPEPGTRNPNNGETCLINSVISNQKPEQVAGPFDEMLEGLASSSDFFLLSYSQA